MHAIFMVTDERLSDIAAVQAKRIAQQWDCDVHVFVERRDPGIALREVRQDDRITYHYEELGHLLPEGLPEDRKWPKIVYLRLFAPSVLPHYDRLLYLDVDILSLRAEPAIWDVDLPAGLGAVSDIATLERAPYDIKALTRDEWLATIGVTSGRYLNSGVLLIDTARWAQYDFAQVLLEYFRRFPDAVRFDQDFLAHLFDGRWTELSPRMNYQACVLELGLMGAVGPVFVHFCRTHKPWHGDTSGWRAPTDPRYTELYRQMLMAEGLDPAAHLRPSTVNALRRCRYGLRAWMRRRFGLVTARERRDMRHWQDRSRAFERFMRDGLASGRFADETRATMENRLSPPVFDGRFAVAAESRLPE
ncbi:glycosyltransferase [Paracoccus nototheniae]|uniref:Glycosyltransferase family 8 protein n=1 Tax=Paracoccus nototheniae TaxID=2489002 RepID=A0ABW4DRN6_9RHOB|nr:glycosyltransferase [Paracoccus nototheniae]